MIEQMKGKDMKACCEAVKKSYNFTSKNPLREFTRKNIIEIKDKSNLFKFVVDISEIYNKLFLNKGCLDVIFSQDIRVPIRTIYGEGSEEHIFSKKNARISFKEKKNLINEASRKVYENNFNLMTFEKKEIMNIIKKSLESQDVYIKTVGLLMASGCRPIELLVVSKFEKLEDKIEQIGIAKSRHLKSLFKKLILISPEEFIKEVENIRNVIKGTKNDYRLLGEAIKSITGRKIKLYTSRKIYAALSYRLYCNNMSFSAWINVSLGHSKNSLNTSNNYSTIKIFEQQRYY